MSKLIDYENYVMQCHKNGSDVSLQRIISGYMRRQQRTTFRMIKNHVYRKIGQEFRCPELDREIERIAEMQHYKIVDGYFTVEAK